LPFTLRAAKDLGCPVDLSSAIYFAHTTKSSAPRRADGSCGGVCRSSPFCSATGCERWICSIFRHPTSWKLVGRSRFRSAVLRSISPSWGRPTAADRYYLGRGNLRDRCRPGHVHRIRTLGAGTVPLRTNRRGGGPDPPGGADPLGEPDPLGGTDPLAAERRSGSLCYCGCERCR
jgi:hypothetical protein